MNLDDILSRFVDILNQYGPASPQAKTFQQLYAGEAATLLDEAIRAYRELHRPKMLA